MPVKSLFNLILKALGIFFIGNILESLSHTLSVLVYLPQYSTPQEGWYNLGVTLPPLVLYSFFSYILIFRTNGLVNILRLDKNTREGWNGLQLPRSVILGSVIILMGCWLVVNGIPEFIRHAVYYYQERKLYVRMARPDISYLAMSCAKMLVGLVLIFFNRRIVRVIERRLPV